MKILFYGCFAQVIGPELQLDDANGCTVAELRQRLVADHPQAAETLANRRARACVGNSLVGEDYVVAATDQIEFLAPVSGG